MTLAGAILLFFALQWGLSAAGFIINLPLTGAQTVLALGLTCLYLMRRPRPRTAICQFLAVFTLSLLIQLPFQDYSWDGNSYHYDALSQLIAGWNPFGQPLPIRAMWPEWLAYFSKGTWYTTASMQALTGLLNVTKYGSLLLLVPPVLIAYEVWKNTLWAILWGFSPIGVSQVFTKYVDGQLGAVLAAVIALCCIPKEKWRLGGWMIWVSSIILLVNLKLTGALYGAILMGGLTVYWTFTEGRVAQFTIRRLWGASLIGGGVAVLIGFNPYITQYAYHTLMHRAPFYPITYDQLTSIDYNTPVDLRGKSFFEKGIRSIFSEPGQGLNESLRWQLPFFSNMDRLRQYAYPDVRIAGMGPWFGGAILLTLAVIFLIGRRFSGVIGVLLILLTVSIVTNPELWWARYVPQLWLIPCLVAFEGHRVANAREKWLTRALIGALAINLILVSGSMLIEQVNFNLIRMPLPWVY
jgi:hypothetical protein